MEQSQLYREQMERQDTVFSVQYSGSELELELELKVEGRGDGQDGVASGQIRGEIT